MTEPRTLAIGDVHGHFDRLRCLLEQEGVIDQEGVRVDRDVQVVQLGDLGHHGESGNPTGDRLCWERVGAWIDLVLWGNHDRAVFNRRHTFAGYVPPAAPTVSPMNIALDRGHVLFAATAHGRLLTHAGLHPVFAKDLPKDLDRAVAVLNEGSYGLPVLDAISRERGGRHSVGGILWRDWSEPLSDRWRQVFGHSRSDAVRQQDGHWCVDIAGQHNGRLAGLWLPEQRIAEVQVGGLEETVILKDELHRHDAIPADDELEAA